MKNRTEKLWGEKDHKSPTSYSVNQSLEFQSTATRKPRFSRLSKMHSPNAIVSLEKVKFNIRKMATRIMNHLLSPRQLNKTFHLFDRWCLVPQKTAY